MKTLKRPVVKLQAAVLALTMMLSLMPISVLAADEANTPKEEVVYINLTADGAVEEINVVNIFELKEDGRIVDYGKYESLRNMTGTETITYENEAVSIDTTAGKLYYEGKLSDQTMPWDISIRYFMDGKEYTADEIAGMSGKLKMTMEIKENPNCGGNFFDNYALQASLQLDGDKCTDIIAEAATVANVGNKKQLTYTILPGKGADIEITANVRGFEMDGVSLNGILLNLDVDVNDAALMSQIRQLLNAIQQLDNGSTSLNDGVAQMQKALNTLNAKSPDLVNGSAAFLSGVKQLQTELANFSVSSEDLSMMLDVAKTVELGINDVITAAEAVKNSVGSAAYNAHMANNGVDIGAVKSNNANAANTVQSVIAGLNGELAALEAAGQDTSAIRAQLDQLHSVSAQLNANNAALDVSASFASNTDAKVNSVINNAEMVLMLYALLNESIVQMVDGMANLPDNMNKLTDAVNTVVNEYQKIDNGLKSYTGAVSEIVAGYAQLSSGFDTLRNGASALKNQTAGMDHKISSSIDELMKGITGGDAEIKSFVSEENTNIDGVQFVIKTEGVVAEAVEDAVVEDEAPNTFWSKLVALFKKK